MPKEDYLLKMLEKIQQLLNFIFKLKQEEKSEEIFKISNEFISNNFDFSLKEFEEMDEKEFENHFNKLNLSKNYLEKVCELFVAITDEYYANNSTENMQNLSKKTLILYRILSEKDKTFSFDRESIIEELRKISGN